MRLCLSGNPNCSGVSPCRHCYEWLRTRVLVEAMVAVGGPFTERGAPWPPAFIQAFGDTWRRLFAQEVIPTIQQISTLNASAAEQAAPDIGSAMAPGEEVIEPTSPEEQRAANLVERISTVEEPLGEGYEIPEDRMKEYVAFAKSGGKTIREDAPREDAPREDAPREDAPREDTRDEASQEGAKDDTPITTTP